MPPKRGQQQQEQRAEREEGKKEERGYRFISPSVMPLVKPAGSKFPTGGMAPGRPHAKAFSSGFQPFSDMSGAWRVRAAYDPGRQEDGKTNKRKHRRKSQKNHDKDHSVSGRMWADGRRASEGTHAAGTPRWEQSTSFTLETGDTNAAAEAARARARTAVRNMSSGLLRATGDTVCSGCKTREPRFATSPPPRHATRVTRLDNVPVSWRGSF